MFRENLPIAYDVPADLKKWPSLNNQRVTTAKASVGILQHRDQHRPHMRGRRAQGLGHDHPVKRDAAIAHQRAQLDRIGRCGRSDQAVASVTHPRFLSTVGSSLHLRRQTENRNCHASTAFVPRRRNG
jgi:hypothetical protein